VASLLSSSYGRLQSPSAFSAEFACAEIKERFPCTMKSSPSGASIAA
jgi:hypothetical protein